VLRLLAASSLLATLGAGCGSGDQRAAEPPEATTLAEVKRACEELKEIEDQTNG
jgi:hypothetical protein